MLIPHSFRRWLRLPSRVALILGLGAFPAAVSQADTLDQDGLTLTGDTLIRSEGGRIFLSEGGRESELRLSATPERDRLLRLLEEHGAGGVKLDRDPRLIMSSGGGAGFFWWGARKPLADKPAPVLQNSPQAPAQPRLAPGTNPATPPRENLSPNARKG
jgi:hypothetical protein